MLRRLWNVVREGRLARDIDRELAFHLAEREDELVEQGMTREEAQREARRRFGRTSAIGEGTRDADVSEWLDSVVRDVQYAVRSLRASRGFTIVALLSLALGIGANTAIFSIINALMLRALPVQAPDRLVLVKDASASKSVFTNPLWEQVRDHQDALDDVLAFGDAQFDLAQSGEMRGIDGYWVSGSFFGALGVRAALGRTIVNADDTPGCPAVAAVSHAYWQGALGSDPAIVGRTLTFDGHRVEIVGVVDERFTGLERGRSPQVYVPLCANAIFDGAAFLAHRSRWFLQVVGRLRDGETAAQANARLARSSPAWFSATIPTGWSTANTQDYLSRKLDVAASLDALSQLRGSYSGALFVLMAIVGVVLLIACANVANLSLARAAGRQRELAVRVALGAGRGRVMRQLFTEGLLLSIVGGAAGTFLAWWGSRVLVSLLSTSREVVTLDLTVDPQVLAFTLAVSVATALLFGLAPAWRAARVDPHVALAARGRGIVGGEGRGHGRFRVGQLLVAAQVALSLVLLTCAALLLASFRSMAKMPAGFEANGVLVVEAKLRTDAERRADGLVVQRRLLDRIRAIPGVDDASTAFTTPLGNRGWNDLMQVRGLDFERQEDAETYINLVSDGYFETLGMRLLAGRDFSPTDRPGTPMVAIINETAARRFFPARDAVGESFALKRGDGASPAYEVVGVVSDAKYGSLRDAAPPTAFLAMMQDTSYGDEVNVIVRTGGTTPDIRAAIGRAFAEGAPRATIAFRPLSVQVADAMRSERLLAALSVFFGVLALALATIGLYGTMSYHVARRRREIGIRLALGAARTRVMREVLTEVGEVLALGVVLGVAGALAGTRLVEGFLFGVTPRDPAMLAASVSVLVAVSLLAGWFPARRASRMDPMQTLRMD